MGQLDGFVLGNIEAQRRIEAASDQGLVDQYVKPLLISRAINLGDDVTFKVSYSVHRVSQNGLAAKIVGEYLWSKLAPHGITYLLAPGSGAAPVAAAIAAAALRDNVVLETLHVRDAKKARARERLVEGHLPSGAVKAAFVDDVITTGSTYWQTLDTVSQRTRHIECVAIAIVFDSFHPKGSRAIVASGVPIYSIADRREIGLTRDSNRTVKEVFSPALWMRAGLVSKPQFQTKTVPLVTDTEVICGLDDCAVSAYSIEDGTQLWQIKPPVQRSKGSSCELLLGPDGVLYSGNYAGVLTASRQGEIVWQYRLCHALHSRPTLHDGRLYQNVEDFIEGVPSGRLLCLDSSTGKLLWQVQHPHFGPTGVVVAGGLAITSNNDKNIVAVSLDGRIAWTHRPNALARGRMLAYGNQIIYLDEKGSLVKLDLQSGKELARVRFSTSSAHAEPLLVDGVLVVTDNACHMAGYDPDTLQRLWVNRLRGACRWRPAVHKGYLLTQTTEGGLAATVASTGKKVWENKHRWRWSASPMGLSSTHAAIFSLDGRLTCHKLEI